MTPFGLFFPGAFLFSFDFLLLPFDLLNLFNNGHGRCPSLHSRSCLSDTPKLLLNPLLSLLSVQFRVQEAPLLDRLQPVIEVGLDFIDRAREDLVLENRTFHKNTTVLTPHDHLHRILTRGKDVLSLLHVKVVTVGHV